ncbi:MAG: peptide-methionine (R)-S-oxide reductase MsrB [Clostridia bacterium]|jgi:peptide methionine sulfoxide reductase msrA/msrB
MKEKNKEIWLAGGCFWGVQAYFSNIDGVTRTSVGYANGRGKNPSYHEIQYTGHAETVSVEYNSDKVGLQTILEYFFHIIDPTLINKQGNDVGTQYRTGIYYKDEADRIIIEKFVKRQQKKYIVPIAVEISPLENFFQAEEYHQDYLKKTPGGYCHIDLNSLPEFQTLEEEYFKPAKKDLKSKLTDIQYMVTQENSTEPPFDNEYWDNHKKGIYIDVVTGEPLFISNDKFDSGCGWPSFSKPISENVLIKKTDDKHGMARTEVRSKLGDSHLGHVFTDGPINKGGLRYCINSASLKFIPENEMKDKGYSKYIKLLDK